MSKLEKLSNKIFELTIILIIVFAVSILIVVVIVAGINFAQNYEYKTSQERMLDAYQTFEQECLIREYTKDQCLLIWSKDDD